MNFLAHLALSSFDDHLMVGNFLGDMIRGKEVFDYPEEVVRGIRHHREIDRLTDADPDVRGLTALLADRHGRYAPVVADIGFDYFLRRDWLQLMIGSYPNFRDKAYRALRAARPLMPARLSDRTEDMVTNDWLQLYASPAGMSQVFTRFRRRLSKPELLDGVDESLRELDTEFTTTLSHLFPRLQTLSQTYRHG